MTSGVRILSPPERTLYRIEERYGRAKEDHMLILTRRPREVLRVGDNIKVHVLEVKGGQIRLGVEAPREIPVYREEIWVRIKRGTPATG
jgi:carbon storage regulator